MPLDSEGSSYWGCDPSVQWFSWAYHHLLWNQERSPGVVSECLHKAGGSFLSLSFKEGDSFIYLFFSILFIYLLREALICSTYLCIYCLLLYMPWLGVEPTTLAYRDNTNQLSYLAREGRKHLLIDRVYMLELNLSVSFQRWGKGGSNPRLHTSNIDLIFLFLK